MDVNTGQGGFKPSYQGFALMWTVILTAAITLFFSFATGYIYIEVRRSNRELAHDLLQRVLQFKSEECLSVLNANVGSDCCAMSQEADQSGQHLIYSSNNNHWQTADEKINEQPPAFHIGKKRYEVDIALKIIPEYDRQLIVQADSKNGGLKSELNTLFSNPFYQEFRGKQLWDGGLSWDILYDYACYLNQLKNHPHIANTNSLGSIAEGDGWKNMFAAWRGFTSKKSVGLGLIKKILISPIIRKAVLDIGFSVIPIEQPNGLIYSLHAILLSPSILIHNPYDICLELTSLDCVWNIDLNMTVHAQTNNKDAFHEEGLPKINLRKLISKNTNQDQEGLILELPNMQLKPGEMQWLRMNGSHTNRPNVLKMHSGGMNAGSIKYDLQDIATFNFSPNAYLNATITSGDTWSQLKLVNSKNNETFWRAENITLNSNSTKIIPLGNVCEIPIKPQTQVQYACTYLDNKNNISNLSKNDCGISIHTASWECNLSGPNTFATIHSKVSFHLPTKGFNSLGDWVHLPLIPLDILPKHQFGTAVDFSQSTFSEIKKTIKLTSILNFSRKLNESMWDSYWVCSDKLRNDNSIISIPQTYLKKQDNKNVKATTRTAAQHFWIKGGFNLNCTDPQLWEAFLTQHLSWDPLTIHTFAEVIAELNQQQGPQQCISDWISGTIPGSGASNAVLQLAIDRMHLLNSFSTPLTQAEVIAHIAPYMAVRWDTLRLHMTATYNKKHAFPLYQHYYATVLYQRFPQKWENMDTHSNIKKDSEQSVVPSRHWKVMSYITGLTSQKL